MSRLVQPLDLLLESLNENDSFIRQCAHLNGGFRPARGGHIFKKNTRKALCVLGCSCVGHNASIDGKPGFYVVIAKDEEVRQFLDLQAEIAAPSYVEWHSNDFLQKKFDAATSALDVNFEDFYYFMLVQLIESDGSKGFDICVKQLLKSRKVIGHDFEILAPYLSRLRDDKLHLKTLCKMVGESFAHDLPIAHVAMSTSTDEYVMILTRDEETQA